jgi:hypothetical protein
LHWMPPCVGVSLVREHSIVTTLVLHLSSITKLLTQILGDPWNWIHLSLAGIKHTQMTKLTQIPGATSSPSTPSSRHYGRKVVLKLPMHARVS